MFGLRFPLEVLFDPQMKPDEKVVYGLLAAVRNHDPSYAQITCHLGMSPKRIARVIRALNASGRITSRRPTRLITVNGQRRYADTTKHVLNADPRHWAWMPPESRESVVRACRGRSGVLALLVHAYELHEAARGRPRPSIDSAVTALHISRASAVRARAILAEAEKRSEAQPGSDLDKSVHRTPNDRSVLKDKKTLKNRLPRSIASKRTLGPRHRTHDGPGGTGSSTSEESNPKCARRVLAQVA